MAKSFAFLLLLIALLASSLALFGEMHENAVLKAQLASAQPNAVGGAIFIEPTEEPFDRVTWTDSNGVVHLLACGELVTDKQIGQMRLVSQYRVGKEIAKIKFVIP